MKSIDYYRSREQTYLKHFFLERYLERVGFNICSFKNDFVYVDGFSGPWKSRDEQFEDTSFMIAIQELRKVREGIAKQGRRPPTIRCVFVEKDPKAFRELQQAVQGITDIEITHRSLVSLSKSSKRSSSRSGNHSHWYSLIPLVGQALAYNE